MAANNPEDTAWALRGLGVSQNGTGDITNPLTSLYFGDPYPHGTSWNGPVCPLCGVRYLGSHACAMPQSPSPSRECQHCWCGDPGTINGKPHVSCCMCATRRVKS